MKKVNVIGTTGSGKSTFSLRLANRLECPYLQMDQIFWKPDWKEPLEDEFIAKLEQAISEESWVLDGNYSRTNRVKWKNVDTIIWLDYSYSRTLFQLLKRTLYRAITKKELWPQTGNRESFKNSFFSKESIFLWFIKNYKRNKARYSELEASPQLGNIRFVRLRSPSEAKTFLECINT